MEEKLNVIFSNVNEWLKYSEAKNGVLLALNGALLSSLLSILKDTSVVFKFPVTWCLIPSIIIALTILLISFVPIRDKFFNDKYELEETALNRINLLFYGDLKNLSPPVFLTLIYKSYQTDVPKHFIKPEKDIANQILTNSAITYRKNEFFKTAIYINLIGFTSSIIFFIFKIIITNAS